MSDTSPRLNLPYLAPAQAQKTVTHNEALQTLDALTQLTFLGVGVNTPPAAPAPGDVYGLGTAATAEWAGRAAGTVAQRIENAWMFYTPREGWRGWDIATGRLLGFSGGDWVQLAAATDTMGINAAADTVNRLAVGSQASLFTHVGAGHQMKINKATAANDAGFVLQSGYTTHGMMGLFGTNDLTAKVSPDGSTFYNAFEASATTGQVNFPQGLRLRGGNVMEAYAHGTWTPGFGASTTNPAGAQFTSNGSFVRVGRLVMANFEIAISNRGTGGAGNVQIQNLPFSSTGNFYSSDLRHAGIDFPGSGAPMMRSSGTSLSLFATSGTDLLWSALPSGSGFSLLGTFIYQHAG
jgi:hypothetical protein